MGYQGLPEGITAACGECRRPFPESVNQRERGACPDCGATNIAIRVGITKTGAASASMAADVRMKRPREVADRWTQAKAVLDRLATVGLHQPDHDALRAELRGVYVTLWGLRDASIKAGVVRADVDGVINGDIRIAYAMDLGNADKHGTPLTYPPRSKQQPAFGDVRAKYTEQGWTFDEDVTFGGQPMSGLKVAQDALVAWESHLRGWGLL